MEIRPEVEARIRFSVRSSRPFCSISSNYIGDIISRDARLKGKGIYGKRVTGRARRRNPCRKRKKEGKRERKKKKTREVYQFRYERTARRSA